MANYHHEGFLMSNVTSLNANEGVAARAKREVAEEMAKKGVEKLKIKYRELHAAETVVSNIKREIADLELATEQGNV